MSMTGLTVIHNLSGTLDTTHQNYFQVVNSGLLRGWSAFVLGILAYRAWRLLRGISWPPILALGVEGLLCLLLWVIFFKLNGNWRSAEIFAPFAFAAIVVVFALEQGLLAWLLRKLQWLGTISYSIYLNHLVLIMLIDSIMGHLGYSRQLLTLLYLPLLLAYSSMTYRWVEVPGKQLIRHLGKRMEQLASSASHLPEKPNTALSSAADK